MTAHNATTRRPSLLDLLSDFSEIACPAPEVGSCEPLSNPTQGCGAIAIGVLESRRQRCPVRVIRVVLGALAECLLFPQ
jgi:hypothetical protein